MGVKRLNPLKYSLCIVPVTDSPRSAGTVSPQKLVPKRLLSHIQLEGLAFYGTCPHRQPMENLNLTMLEGQWYEQYSYSYSPAELKCAKWKFSSKSVSEFRLLFDAVLVSSGRRVIDRLEAKLGRHQSVGEFPIMQRQDPSTIGTVMINRVSYKILYTDYNSTCFVWSCFDFRTYRTNNDILSMQFLRILTRDKAPSSLTQAIMVNKIPDLNLNTKNDEVQMKTDQNCADSPAVEQSG